MATSNTSIWGGGPSNNVMPSIGQNQSMSYPTMNNPLAYAPGYGPTSGSSTGTSPIPSYPLNPSYGPTQVTGLAGTSGPPGGGEYVGHSVYENPTFDPSLTGQYYSMLSGLLGQGGGLQNNLLNFLMGGASTIPGAGGYGSIAGTGVGQGPFAGALTSAAQTGLTGGVGSQQLGQMATTGDPISATPEWQAMVQAQQQQIAQNQANLKEQFGFAGELQSSPFGTAMSNYMQQTTADQNSLLGQLQTQALENAANRQLTAGQGIQQQQTGIGALLQQGQMGTAGNLLGLSGSEAQYLTQLLGQGAMAQPGLTMKGQNTALGGVGAMLPFAGAVGGSIAEGLSGGGGAGDVASSLIGMLLGMA